MNTEHGRTAPESKEINNSEDLSREYSGNGLKAEADSAAVMTASEVYAPKEQATKEVTTDQGIGKQASETQAVKEQGIKAQASESKATETRASESKATEAQGEPSKTISHSFGANEGAESEEPETYTAKSDTVKLDTSKSDAAVEQLSIGSKCFGLLIWIAPVFLCILAALQTIPLLLGKELYALYDLGEHVASGLGQNFEPVLVLTPALYWILDILTWIPSHFLSLLYDFLGIESGYWLKGLNYYQVIPLAAALGVVLGVLLLWILALAVGNSSLALASGLVWLVSFACLGLPATAAPELLLSGLLLASLYCLFLGWQKHFAPIWLSVGFLLTALCFLLGGLYGCIPLVASLLFLIWRGSFRRAGAYDGALAFGLMLIALATWAYMTIFMHENKDYFYQAVNGHILNPLRQAWDAAGERSWQFLAVLIILWLPWLGLVLFLPWYKLGSFVAGFWKNRTQNPGRGFIWCALLSCLLVLGLLGEESVLILLIVLPFLAILTAQAVLSLSSFASRGFFLLLAGLLLVLGLGYAGLAIYPIFSAEPCSLQAIQPWPLAWEYTVLQVAIFVVGALIIWKLLNRSQPKGSLLGLAILLTIMVLPLAYYIVPARDLVVEVSPVASPAPGVDAPDKLDTAISSEQAAESASEPVVAPELVVESIPVPAPVDPIPVDKPAPPSPEDSAPLAEPSSGESSPSVSAPARQELLVEGLDTAN